MSTAIAAPNEPGLTMKNLGFDHYNIRLPSGRLQIVAEFYVNVLGLTQGYRPASNIVGKWLYVEDQDIIHLAVDDRMTDARAERRLEIDHVAFRCADLGATTRLLTEAGVPFDKVEDLTIGVVQLFLEDPDGRGIELIFKNEAPPLES